MKRKCCKRLLVWRTRITRKFLLKRVDLIFSIRTEYISKNGGLKKRSGEKKGGSLDACLA